MRRHIVIEPVLNGFVCRVGCQTVVFETPAKLLHNLERYLKEPDVVEKEMQEHALHKDMMNVPAVPCAVNTCAPVCQENPIAVPTR